MPLIVVTRLRLKDAALQDEFFTDPGADALADANNAWWTVTAWQERRMMHAYVGSNPHRSIMARLDRFCDEATFVDWEQDSPDLPDWQANWRQIVGGGTIAELTQPSAAHQTRDFPAPVEPPPAEAPA